MSPRTPLDHARDLMARGLSPIPVPHKAKGPHIKGWQSLRLTRADLPRYFNGAPANVGTLLGEFAGWIVDVDLDHARAVDLADSFLPTTGMVWGRDAKPRSHRLYRLTRPADTRKWPSKTAGMIVELRSTGCQTIAPGSTHPSGDAVRWDDDGEPATIDPSELIAAIEALAGAVLAEFGEGPDTTGSPPPRPVAPAPHGASNYGREALRREAATVAATPEGGRNDALNRAAFNLGTLIAVGEVGRADAESELMTAARSCGLSDAEARRTIASGIASGLEHPRQRPAPSVNACHGFDAAERGAIGSGAAGGTPAPEFQFHSHPRDGAGGIEFNPIPLDQLGPSEPPAWVWPGYIARGHFTLLTGLWKAGKSTLLGHLLRDLERGGGLSPEPLGSPVLVMTEESTSHWMRRRDELELGGSVHIQRAPVLGRPTMQQWLAIVQCVADAVRGERYALVVIDTLSAFWPIDDENDAAKVGAALTPLRCIADAGAAVLLVHHPRKGDGGQGTSTRGSGALPAFTDVILELRRMSTDDASDKRRTLTAYGRFDETPAETVIELGEDGYRVIGDKATVKAADRDTVILGLLPVGAPGATVDELRRRYPEPIGLSTIRGALNSGASRGLWKSSGKGVKGEPVRYWREGEFDSDSSAPREETESESDDPGLLDIGTTTNKWWEA